MNQFYNNTPNLQQPQYQVNRPIYQPMMQQTFAGLKGRPVASIEEARASIIDFDGSIFYFPDLANKRIYTKQINMDGTALLCLYELREMPIEQPSANQQYITREEFEAAIQSLRQEAVPRQASVIPQESAPAPAKSMPLNF